MVNAKARYESLRVERETYLSRAEDAAAVTIPALMPPKGWEGQKLPVPWQSVGARGVSNLASKLLLALLPPGSSFFRLPLDDYQMSKMAEEAQASKEDVIGAFEAALSRVERAVSNRLEQLGSRTTVFEALKQLIVSGNVLIQIMKGGKLRLHFLHSYVVKRSPSGRVLEIVVLEKLSRANLPPLVQAIIDEKQPQAEADDPKSITTNIELYTRIRVEGTKYLVHQEVEDAIVPGSEGSYPMDKIPWLALRYTQIDGEDYGRSFIEEYLGDLQSLDSLSMSIVEYAAIAARLIGFVNEGGTVSRAALQNAKNGDILDGRADDVSILSFAEKFNDFQVAFQTGQGIEKRLEQAFLLLSSVQRSGERVTAEEIRRLADELEQSLGGVYSILAEELQRPLAVRLMHEMAKDGSLPSLPEKLVQPKIITGLEALGRTADLQRLDLFLQGIGQTFGPDALAQWVNIGAYMSRRAAALSVSIEGLVRSEEEVQAAQQAQQQADMAGKLASPGLKFIGDRMSEANQQPEGG